LVRIADEVDLYLEMAEIQYRPYMPGGPIVLFENVKGCRFPAALQSVNAICTTPSVNSLTACH
jgi:UbiD family decarboxylase